MTTGIIPDLNNVFSKSRNIPAKQPILPYMDLMSFIDKNGLSPNPACFVMYAMLAAGKEIFKVPIDPIDADKAKDIWCVSLKIGTDIKIVAWADNYPKGIEDPNFTKDAFSAAQATFRKGDVFIAELCGAYQVGGLKERNMESYFKMAQADIPVSKIMNLTHYLSQMIPKLVEDQTYQAHIVKVDWLRYHTAAASSQQLVQKLIDDMGAHINVDGSTAQAVADALATPWDKSVIDLIPTKALQVTYCYLEAAKQLPDNWYQGIKAVNRMSTVARVRTKAFFTVLLSKLADVEAINNAGTVDIVKGLVQVSI
jgi:hypothetical protein